MSKLNDNIMAACKALGSPEKIAETFSIPLSTAKTVLRTKKPTFAMAEKYLELSATPGALPSINGAVTVEQHLRDNPPADRESAEETLSKTMGDQPDISIIPELVAKMGELIQRHGEVVAALSNMGERFTRIEAGLEAHGISIGQMQMYLSQLHNMQPQIARPIEAPRNDTYEHPELMSTTRPSRTPTIESDRMPQIPVFAEIPSLNPPATVFAEPARATPAQPAVAAVAPQGSQPQHFDWLSPHGKAAAR